MNGMKLGLFLFSVVVSTALVGACSSGGGSTTQACEEVCGMMNQCDPVEFDLDECRADCDQFADIMRRQAFDSMTDCIMAASCATLDPDGCMQQAMQAIPAYVLDGFLGSLCDIRLECEGMDKQTCLAELRAEEDIEGLKIFSDAALNCLGGCLSDMSCAELAVGDPMEDCAEECDLSFDDSTVTVLECVEMEGSWSLESVSCSGTPADLTGYQMLQGIQADCGFSLTRTVSGSCTAIYTGYYQQVGGPYLWNVDRIECSQGCTTEECTPDNAADLGFEVSVDMQSGDMIFNSNDSSGMHAAGLAPCQNGFQVMVWGK